MTSGNAFLCFCLSECQCFAEAVISLSWECESSLSAAPAQAENKGEGEFDIIEYHLIDNSINDNYNEREKEGFPESPNRWSSRNEITKGEYNSDSYNASDGEADGYNAGLDKETSSRESQQTSSDASSHEHQGRGTRLIKTGTDGTVFPRVIEAPDITPQGEIYGFIAPNGDMYLDETVISPEHPIHEYTHL